ncbi:cupin domain-containing protein [Actinokineospora fastidiosa]|uniref:cupin domain-containing protein n=1 Tax=Actinokineospora fastidiosa TaxID=1816 RepID=UPI001E4BAA4B|nr:cupin domain-containing protein [Actinokineospora fastidiosa]
MELDVLLGLTDGAERPVESSAPAGLRRLASSKRIVKPWGEERWLVPEGSPFGFKAILVRAGARTSLQYHEVKEEANLVLRGRGRLTFASTTEAARTEHELAPGDIVHVAPGEVHRIEALSDLVLLEVSTPELDDVIRIEDDAARGNGRIPQEHRG